MAATQQSVALSSQRTAQYHWGTTPQAPTQTQQQTSMQQSSAASQPAPIGNKPREQHDQSAHAEEAYVRAAGLTQQQEHRKAAFVNQEAQQARPPALGVSLDSVLIFHWNAVFNSALKSRVLHLVYLQEMQVGTQDACYISDWSSGCANKLVRLACKGADVPAVPVSAVTAVQQFALQSNIIFD